MADHSLSRRDFVASSAKLALGALVVPPMVVPRHVLGRGHRAPSERLNVAIVGAGGMGIGNAMRLVGENVVALCDVDFPFVERALAQRLRPRPAPVPPPTLPPERVAAWQAERALEAERTRQELVAVAAVYAAAARYADYRELLAKQRDLDAVVIATPDHTHAVIAAAAMRAGKHVYVQKPLTYSVHEARALARIAAETKVVTQMGNQGHSSEGTRRINELIASGVLGPVREVHAWTDRPQRLWAQGIPRPGAEPAPPPPAQAAAAQGPNAPPRWNMSTVDRAVLKAMADGAQSPPEGLHWDLFLGPAQETPYHPAYHPFSWRGWVGFGVSALGDMGAHLLDQPYWALGLGHPTSITASSTGWGGSADGLATYPLAMTAQYEFPARGAQPPVRLHWYDGGLLPPRPPHLPEDVVLGRGGGVFVGERGILTYETYGDNPTVYPAAVAAEAAQVPRTFPRVTVPHEVNWVQACKGEGTASSPLEYGARLTEVMLLGIAALRAGPGRRVSYDGPGMRLIDAPEADRHLTRSYRSGWSL